MSNTNDIKLIKKFIEICAARDMRLEDMGDAVGRTKGWASQLVNGKIKNLRWRTRNRIAEYLGEL